MSMWNADPQALPSCATSIQASPPGRGAGLVEERQPVRVEIELTVKPDRPLGSDLQDMLDWGSLHPIMCRCFDRMMQEIEQALPRPQRQSRRGLRR